MLRRRPYREHDDIVDGIGYESGRLSAVVKGSRRRSSGGSGLFEPPVLLQVRVRPGQSLDSLSQPVLQNAFLALRKELPRLLTAGFLGRLFLAALPERQADQSVFRLLLGLYEALAEGASPVACGLWGQDRLLAVLGIAPHLESCTLCGNSSVSGFCAADGGMLCDDCYHGSGFAVGAGALELARQLREGGMPFHSGPESIGSIRLLGRVYKEQFQTQLGLPSELFRKVL